MPKTGGTFVTDVLSSIHDPSVSQEWRPIRRFVSSKMRALRGTRSIPPSRYGWLHDIEPRHGTCHDIKFSQRKKPILSIARNPYDWYVSQFEFAWWKRTFEYESEKYPTPVGSALEHVLPEFERDHPEFPELSFETFIELCDRASHVYNRKPGTNLGLLTHGFIRYFYRHVQKALPRLTLEYIRSGAHVKDMFPVEFLRTNNLNEDLTDALINRGYASQDVAFIQRMGKVLPMGRGRGDGRPWEDYYTPQLKARIRERDWPMFEMFPHFDI